MSLGSDKLPTRTWKHLRELETCTLAKETGRFLLLVHFCATFQVAPGCLTKTGEARNRHAHIYRGPGFIKLCIAH